MSKITFVGAGSVVFSKTLICDILQNKALETSTICLMDIDPARLKVAEILARKIVEQLGVKAKVESTLDLKKACTGARYVITMIQVGGYKPATVTDFEIPKKYGLRQTIADTLGVGGVFRALRTMPELVKVGNALRDFGAADPLFLNYSNPMAMNMMAIDRVCQIPSVGLCHSVQGTSQQLANYAGLPYSDISYKVAGINHVAFFLEFKYRGQDAYPLLFKALDNPRTFDSDKVRFEMMRRLGYFVTESSEHFSEYCPWFIHHGDKIIEEFKIPLDEYIRRCKSIIATWKDTEKSMLADSKVTIGKSVEYGSQIINAIESGTPTVIYGNVPNVNLITNLPNECCVEVPCLVDKQGIQPTVIGDLPPQLAAMCRTNIAVQELAVEAFMTGKREHIYHAVMMDPHTSSQLTLDNIWKMCDELIEAHQRDGFLPQFAPVRKNTGRTASTLQRVMVSIEDQSRDFSDKGPAELVLVVRNETSSRFKGTLSLDLDRGVFRLKGKAEISCDLAAGAVKRIPFQVVPLKPGVELEVVVTGSSPLVFAQSFSRPVRNRVKAGSGAKAAPVKVVWSGNTMAEGTLAVEKSGIRLKLRVSDTNPATDLVWQSAYSAMDLYIDRLDGKSGSPLYLVALPNVKKPSVIFARGREAVAGSRLTVKADKGGYDADLFVPFKAVSLQAGKPFLMEIQIRVNGLGDAHGRVDQTWQGSRRPGAENRSYAIIQPV